MHCCLCGNKVDEANDDQMCETRRVIALGVELNSALVRGQTLHPWESADVQLRAVISEAVEVWDELFTDAKRDEVDVDRLYSEVVDLWVTVRRLKDGR